MTARAVASVVCILALCSVVLVSAGGGADGLAEASVQASADVNVDVVESGASVNIAAGLTDDNTAAERRLANPSDPIFQPHPVPLLVNDTDGRKLVIQPEGLQWLEALGDTPLCIVVTAGPARSGKSFLVNNLLGAEHSKGFGVGHGVQVRPLVAVHGCCSVSRMVCLRRLTPHTKPSPLLPPPPPPHRDTPAAFGFGASPNLLTWRAMGLLLWCTWIQRASRRWEPSAATTRSSVCSLSCSRPRSTTTCVD